MAAKKMDLGAATGRVAANLRALRHQRGYSTRQLADRLTSIGWPLRPLGITYIENGQRRVDVDDLVALAIALNCSPNRLLLPQWVDMAKVDIEHDVRVVSDETRASTEAVWKWAVGEESLKLRGREDDPVSGSEAALWQLENQPHHYPEVIEMLSREVATRGESA